MDIFKFLTKLFGTKSQRDIKAIKPIVDEILRIYPQIDALSNDDLRAKTRELKKIVQSAGDELRKEIDTLKVKIEDTPIEEREFIFKKIDKLEKEILERYEEKLNEVLPTAFAIVKSTCRRFKDSTGRFDTVLTATDFDREMAVMYPDVVQIDGDKALYDDDFEESDWNMDPYPCQLFGGVAIHQGKIAEMATGEGKTLTSTLPIYLNALTGNGVHVVTVNDYLAKRDADWMGQVHEFLGLSVGVVLNSMSSEQRQKAYKCDITYVTNNRPLNEGEWSVTRESGDYYAITFTPQGDGCIKAEYDDLYHVESAGDAEMVFTYKCALTMGVPSFNISYSGRIEMVDPVMSAKKPLTLTIETTDVSHYSSSRGIMQSMFEIICKDDYYDVTDKISVEVIYNSQRSAIITCYGETDTYTM